MVKGVWFVAFLMLQQSSSPQPPLHNCRIVVVDSEGAEIGRAHILIHRDPVTTSALPDRILDADVHGVLSLSVPDGFYDVCAMSSAFAPACRKVAIRNRYTDVKFRLAVSPEVLDQIGDRFE